MTWLNAFGTESPATTAQRITPKVAGAIVTVEYSKDTDYTRYQTGVGGRRYHPAHWCTIRVSVILTGGSLVHHPVCR
jgi:hypothetical protein